jgi:hypothetical protein
MIPRVEISVYDLGTFVLESVLSLGSIIGRRLTPSPSLIRFHGLSSAWTNSGYDRIGMIAGEDRRFQLASRDIFNPRPKTESKVRFRSRLDFCALSPEGMPVVL